MTVNLDSEPWPSKGIARTQAVPDGFPKLIYEGSIPFVRFQARIAQPGDIGNGSYLRHGDNLVPNGLSRGCKLFLILRELAQMDEVDYQPDPRL
jgi:hypothetical protein